MSYAITIPGATLAPAVSTSDRWAITFDDLEWFQSLDQGAKLYVRHHLAIFSALDQAQSIKHEAIRQARIYRHEKYFPRAKPGHGMSAKALQDKFRKFKQSGYSKSSIAPSWSNGNKQLSKEFIDYWQALASQFRRDDASKAAWRHLIMVLWAGGEAIPGYGTWQSWFLRQYPGKALPRRCPTDEADLPAGWSYRNLMYHLPRKQSLSLARHGFKDADDDRKYLHFDRSDLKPLHLIAIDDFWIDQYVYVRTLGKGRPSRAVGIIARDVATGYILGWFLKPRTEDEFGKKEGIRQSEVKQLVRLIIENHGLPPWPITFLVENASASILQETQLLIEANFGERIRIKRTGLYNDLVLKHGFRERGGKPREKAWIESFIRQLHVQGAFLPAQTGATYDRMPGDTAQLVKYCERLLSNPDFTQADIDSLRLPMMAIEDAHRFYASIIQLLMERRDHNLQGFDTITRWRLEDGDPWQPEHTLSRLAPHLQSRVQLDTVLETPAERFQRLSPSPAQVSQVPPELTWFLYPAERSATIKNGNLSFQDKTISHEILEFWQPGHDLLRQHEGRKVAIHYDPDSPDHIHLTTPGDYLHRKHLGTLTRDQKVNPLDQDAIDRASGAIHRETQHSLREVRRLQQEQDEALSRDKAYNDYIAHQAAQRRSKPTHAPATQATIREVADDLTPEDTARYLASTHTSEEVPEDDLTHYL